jgi:hypothetical protein
MTGKGRFGIVVAVAIVAGAGLWGRASVHAQPAAAAERRSGEASATADVLPALLVEVRGLRAAMEQMASDNAHAQLLVGRLQLQEGRIAGMVRRLDTVRDSLSTAKREYEQIRGSLQMLEGDHAPGEIPPQGVLGGLRQQVASAKANVDRLSAEENQLTQDLTTEQGRWIEINQRLDELERSLTKR